MATGNASKVPQRFPPQRFLIEACVSTIDDAITAARLGADRLELSAALETDGVSPSLGMLKEVIESVSIPVVTLIRLRSGDFVYQPAEVRAMVVDAERALAYGAEAIAVGCLTYERHLDIPAMRLFAEKLGGTRCVCHRAIDHCQDMMDATRRLIDLGYRRILTSGGATNAAAGTDTLRSLQRSLGDRIEILVAGGVAASNILDIVTRTGCSQLHGSFRKRGAADCIPRLDPQQLEDALKIRDNLC